MCKQNSHKTHFKIETVFDSKFENSIEDRIRLLQNKDKWIPDNQDKLNLYKDKIINLYKNGLIPDTEADSVRNYQLNYLNKKRENYLNFKEYIASNLDILLELIEKNIQKYIPLWNTSNVKIIFNSSNNYDFYSDYHNIVISIEKLLQKSDLESELIKGLTHEFFHCWMIEGNEKFKFFCLHKDKHPTNLLKEYIFYKIIDEGLAVLISQQSLEKHHITKDYGTYKAESFIVFNKFLAAVKKEELVNFLENEFKNMGHFYIVGYTIAKLIHDKLGIEYMKMKLPEIRRNPFVLFDEFINLDKGSENKFLLDMIC